MIISLDRKALKALIDADPQFELDLKNAVVSEVGRRFFEKDAKRVIAAAEPELFAMALAAIQGNEDLAGITKKALEESITHRDSSWYGRAQVKPETKACIEQFVAERKVAVVAEASNAISIAFSEQVKKSVETYLALTNIDELIEKRAARLVETEINRMVDERFKARMADIKAMMS